MTGKKRKPGRGRVGAQRNRPSSGGKAHPEQATAGAYWIYGFHAARAALSNPARVIRRAVLTSRAAAELGSLVGNVAAVEPGDPEAVARLLPNGAVHQGIAILCEPLPTRDLAEILAPNPGRRLVAVLDQVTDPHNEGAILRSASAFGVRAVIVQNRHAAPESGVLAKTASGALDKVARVAVVNIARTLEDLAEMGFWRIALTGDAGIPLSEAVRGSDIALVLGAEGTGLRRLVQERCDVRASIPTTGTIESLNVSNAAAIAFYALSGIGSEVKKIAS